MINRNKLLKIVVKLSDKKWCSTCIILELNSIWITKWLNKKEKYLQFVSSGLRIWEVIRIGMNWSGGAWCADWIDQ